MTAPGDASEAGGRFVLASGATFKTVGGRPALYRSADRSLHVLSPTAELLCRCLERPATLAELTDRLASLTEGEHATIARDLAEIVPDFVARRIVEPAGVSRAELPTPAGVVGIEAPAAVLADLAELYPGLTPRPDAAADAAADTVATARIAATSRGLALSADGRQRAEADDWRRLEVAFEHWLERLLLDRRGARLALHAGAVELDGRGWIVAGRSGAGKTSTAFHCIELGARLVCEEIALVDESGRVAALPRALELAPAVVAEARAGGGPSAGALSERGDRALYRARRLARRPARVDGVVLPRYAPREAPRLSALAPAAAVTELLPHFFEPKGPAEALFDAVIGWSERWRVIELVYPDGPAARPLLRRLESAGG